MSERASTSSRLSSPVSDDFRREFDTLKASMSAKLKVATRQRDEARTRASDWQKRYESTRDDTAELERRNAECQRLIFSYEREMRRLQDDRALRAQLRDNAVHNREVDRRIVELEAANAEVNRMLDEERRTKEEAMAARRDECDRLRRECDDAWARCETAVRERDQLIGQLKEKSGGETEGKASLQNYALALSQRDVVLKEFGQLKMEKDVLINQVKIKVQELDDLKQKYNGLKSKANNLKSLVYRLREAHVPEYVTVRLATKAEIGFFLETQICVKEIQPNSLAHQKGILPGDVILKVNDQPLASLSVFDVQRLVVTAREGLSLLIERKPTARIDDIIMTQTAGDALSLRTQGETRSLKSESRRQDMKVMYGSTDSLDGEVVSFVSGARSLGGPSLTATRRQREIVIEQPDPKLTPKQRELGLQLKGGNQVGIFVSKVNPSGPAQGLQKGDQILAVNGFDTTAVTLEEAYILFMQAMLSGQVKLAATKNAKKYKSLTVPYDSFFVRCNFSYDGSAVNEMSFTIGDLLHITESMPVHHHPNSWMARKVGPHQNSVIVGAVPNEARAQDYLRTSRRSGSGGSLAYERLEPSRLSTLMNQGQERGAISSKTKRELSLGDQLSLQDRVSSFRDPALLPSHIADELCQLLDRDSPTERDWRDLATMLGLADATIAQFAQDPKPTSRILESWRNASGEKGSLEWLVKSLFRMGRIDAAMLLAPYADLDMATTTINL